jgi:GDP-4-dehydro-6-deoxy-D-mannose reductase
MAHERLLITGVTGFVGRAAARYWREEHPGVELWGASDRPRAEGIDAARYARLDLRDAGSVRSFVALCRPTAVLHLAGLLGGADLGTLLAVNAMGTETLYEALAAVELPGLRIVQVGSAAMYGRLAEDELPVTEDQPLRPVTAYAVSKVAQEYVSIAAGYSRGLSIVRARVFNMLGPGQPLELVPMTFVVQLAAVRDGRADRIRAGLLSARRDFVDVRDAVRAFDLMLARGKPGRAYNVGSGEDVSVSEIIEALEGMAGIEAPVEVDRARMRPVDVPRVRADISRAGDELGWRPGIPLETSLRDMWREAG